jgi:hypothetical protein
LGSAYHPEYDYSDIAGTAERYGETLVTEGMFRDGAALGAFVTELRHLHANPSDAPLLWKHGLDAGLRTETLRLLEIRNSLKAAVLPQATHTCVNVI